MRDPINFLDHVVEYPGRFKETDLGNNIVQHDPAPGEVVQEGTPLNAANMNLLDTAALQAIMMGGLHASFLRQLADKVDAQAGDQIEVTLTNSQQYPFNNSNQAVQLPKNRKAAVGKVFWMPELILIFSLSVYCIYRGMNDPFLYFRF